MTCWRWKFQREQLYTNCLVILFLDSLILSIILSISHLASILSYRYSYNFSITQAPTMSWSQAPDAVGILSRWYPETGQAGEQLIIRSHQTVYVGRDSDKWYASFPISHVEVNRNKAISSWMLRLFLVNTSASTPSCSTMRTLEPSCHWFTLRISR